MKMRKATGRPQKVNYKIMARLADSIQHNSTITEACRYAGISRQTYYCYLNNPVFKEAMNEAKANRNRVVFIFLTIP